MPNLVWKTNMKVKEITLSEAEITTKPMPGATELDVNGKSVGVAHDAQTAQMISQAAKDGKLSLGATPDGTQPGQQTNTLGEEPANSTNTITVKRGPNGLVASDGDPVMVTSTGREVDQAYMSDPSNSINRVGYINFNGKMIPALNTGHKWKVGPKTLQMLMSTPTQESAELGDIRKLSGL